MIYDSTLNVILAITRKEFYAKSFTSKRRNYAQNRVEWWKEYDGGMTAQINDNLNLL